MRLLDRRPVGRGPRAAVLILTSVAAGAVVGALVLLVAVVVQPSFTRLEQSAVRLVPPGWDAQPPVEIVPEFGAFRRSYQVTFVPEGSEDVTQALVARADDLGWQPVSTASDRVVLQRGGVRAVVRADVETVVTSLAPQVGRWQRVAVVVAAIIAGVVAPVALARRWRRRPQPVA